ncbi:hypothetical protein [Gryllotalpicola koreensis]|uniref:DUF4232 domain-containing protein n=1 Tax=Gryllotalpicola koreensis TaxID=993086 RepID=A0ABP8A5I1_9MICO
MSTPHHPVGRRSAAVYRRRRLVVLLVLLAIIAAVLFLIFRPGGGGAATAGGTPTTPASTAQSGGSGTSLPGPSSSAKPASTPTSTPKPVAGKPCASSNVDVEAITDASSYRSGARPLLSLSLTNTGQVMCTLDAGTATMVFTITSGKEPYWTSTDCQSNPVHTDIKLEPGKTLTTTPIPWDRTRSSKTTCGGARPAVPAGGAAYHLSVSVAGIASKTSKQFLLY